jgi:preprotein translocase subunit SecF
MEIFKSNKIYNFMEKKIQFLILSVFLFIGSIGLLAVNGLNFGVDFSGGTVVQIKYEKKAPINKIRQELSKTNVFKNSSVSNFGSEEEIIIKIKTSSTDIGTDIGDRIKVLLDKTGVFEIRRVDMVGPKVGGELQEKGLLALLISFIVILIYVSFRFEWRFAIASIFALIHDITITMGVLSLLKVDINLDILAAILTILGYSLNDTIIVFDRIREGINKSKTNDLDKVVNQSVSNTLSRTTLTSLTTFFVVFTLYVFGGEIINGFSLTLLVGVIIGTYSSIFVASTALVKLGFSIKDWKNSQAEQEKQRKDKERMRAMFEQGSV